MHTLRPVYYIRCFCISFLQDLPWFRESCPVMTIGVECVEDTCLMRMIETVLMSIRMIEMA